jgi:transposase
MTEGEFHDLYSRDPAACWRTFATMQEQVKELGARLKVTSANSHFPPSRDLAKPKRNKANNSRERNGRKPGGQPGHAGHTLAFSDAPRKTVEIRPESCQCGHGFSGQDLPSAIERRQVHDIPKPVLEVTEFQAMTILCPACGCHCKGAFPEDVSAPVQYGPDIRALAVNLHVRNFIPYGRAAELLNDWYAARLSAGTLRNFVEAAARNAQPTIENIKDGIASAAVAHFDETGSRCGGKREWDHVASTSCLTFYFHHANRGSKAMNAIGILPRFNGTAIHDHFSPYYIYKECGHAQCGAHLLRDNQGVHDAFGWQWPLTMKQVLKDGKCMADTAKAKGLDKLTDEQKAELKLRYRNAIAAARAEMPPPPVPSQKRRGRKAKGKAHSLIDRHEAYEDQILRFVDDLRVPFDNNLAERDIRMDKLKQKISGGYRSKQGAKDFCDLRSIISTAVKQSIGAMAVIRELVCGAPISIST